MDLSLAQVQMATGAAASSSTDTLEKIRTKGWSIDSRTLQPGDLFFAIKGDRYDGHRFVESVFEQGAIAAVVSEPIANFDRPVLRVPDTIHALQQIAHYVRCEWGKPIIGVTGSAGKTGTKDIIADLLNTRFRVGKTIGNFNNHIGLPLTILRMPADAEIAVLEMGMNHAGEIRRLAEIAEPDIGVITTVGYAHIESFDSIEGIAAAKRELIESLPASGIAILNADDKRVLAFRSSHPGETLTYGFSEEACVRARELEMNSEGTSFTVRNVRFHTRLLGRHAVSNVLAGLAVAIRLDVPLAQLPPIIEALSVPKMRGERSVWRGITILNDCYNSNPEAAQKMIDVLCEQPARRKIAVLGEMLELGHFAEKLHRELGAYAANAGVDVLVGVRGVSRLMVEEAVNAGLSDHAAFFFDQPEAAGTFLRHFVRPGDAILFKGSRATRIEIALATMEE